jgi:hypothetical protein
MSSDDIESTLRDGLRAAIDPMVPGPNAGGRVMDVIAASRERSRVGGFRIGQGLGAFLVASVVVLLAGGAIGLSLALRSHPIPSGPSKTGPPGPTVPTSTPTATPTPSPSASPSPSPSYGVVACEGAILRAHFIDFDGAAGAEGGDIMLENAGHAACTMDGYTNLQGSVDGRMTQLGVTHIQAVLINNNNNGTLPTVRLITLEPGQAAYVAVEWTDVQSTSTSCPVYRTLLITPPHGSTAVTMTVTPPVTPPFMLCGSHGAAIWIDEAPVSLTRYFYQP